MPGGHHGQYNPGQYNSGEENSGENKAGDAPSAVDIYRPYMAAGGRTTPQGGEMDVTSLIVARDSSGVHARARMLSFDERAVLQLCHEFQQGGHSVSIAELGAAMNFPAPVVKVLVGDLQHKGFVFVSNPEHHPDGRPTADLMQRVLDGLRKLPTG